MDSDLLLPFFLRIIYELNQLRKSPTKKHHLKFYYTEARNKVHIEYTIKKILVANYFYFQLHSYDLC